MSALLVSQACTDNRRKRCHRIVGDPTRSIPVRRPDRTVVTSNDRRTPMSIETNWTLDAVQSLRTMAREGVSVSVISLRLKRPVEAVSAKLTELGITPKVEA
jgi:hypothetical protein